jgi:F0F1-type ATP synthase delta subunit
MVLKPPLSIATRLDVLRAVRELEDFENSMSEAHVKGHHVPPLTPLLKDIADENNVNLHQKNEREQVFQKLEELRTSAPTIHISFAVEPEDKFVKKIAEWFRNEISKDVVLQIGIQPSIGIGCVVRTTNKFFDFSLRKHLNDKSDMFRQKLEGIL